jgi:hypothetical protein
MSKASKSASAIPIGTGKRLALPADPQELLSDSDRKTLREDLDRIARDRREAETASANLRLS